MSPLAPLLRPRPRPRHARRGRLAPALAAGGLATALLSAAGTGVAAADAPPTDEVFDLLAQCESSGNWHINTGNGYYGGLQFSLQTWQWIGYPGYPHEASRETQIEAGRKLQGLLGWGQWPACAAKLGLHGDHWGPAPQPAPLPSIGVPAFDGTVTLAHIGTFRADVQAWQARMRERGWWIGVDGHFGPQSSSVAQRFAAEKGLPLAPGTLDATVFEAAWTAPVT